MAKEKVGALWAGREAAKTFGDKIVSGQVEIGGRDGDKKTIILAKNPFKKETKHPDYRVYVEVGAGWVKAQGNGDKFISIAATIPGLDGDSFVAFKNGYKETDKHPDLILYPSEPRESGGRKQKAADDDVPF